MGGTQRPRKGTRKWGTPGIQQEGPQNPGGPPKNPGGPPPKPSRDPPKSQRGHPGTKGSPGITEWGDGGVWGDPQTQRGDPKIKQGWTGGEWGPQDAGKDPKIPGGAPKIPGRPPQQRGLTTDPRPRRSAGRRRAARGLGTTWKRGVGGVLGFWGGTPTSRGRGHPKSRYLVATWWL